MAITLVAQPLTANASLAPADITSLVAAVQAVLTLPSGKEWNQVSAVNITIQPSGAGTISLRFTS